MANVGVKKYQIKYECGLIRLDHFCTQAEWLDLALLLRFAILNYIRPSLGIDADVIFAVFYLRFL